MRHYCCGNKKCKDFGKPLHDKDDIQEALAPDGAGKLFCRKCGRAIALRDAIEKKFESPAVKEKAREMQGEVQAALDNESRELILAGHAFCIVAEAGQIYRGYTNSDHGIDGRIAFKDDRGRASGKRLYVQLKSGDSYLTKRQSDGPKFFRLRTSGGPITGSSKLIRDVGDPQVRRCHSVDGRERLPGTRKQTRDAGATSRVRRRAFGCHECAAVAGLGAVGCGASGLTLLPMG